MVKVQCVGGIVHVVDTLPDRNQAEQCARTRRIAATVEQRLRNLESIGRSLDHVPVISVRGEDVTVRRDGQTEWIVQAAALRDCLAGVCARLARDGISDCSDWRQSEDDNERVMR
jgi:hypothetical protein